MEEGTTIADRRLRRQVALRQARDGAAPAGEKARVAGRLAAARGR